MQLNRWCVISLVSGMVFVHGSVQAIDCNTVRHSIVTDVVDIVVVGVIYDARSHSIAEETLSRLSEDELMWLEMFAGRRSFAPVLVAEEGTPKIYEVFIRDEEYEETIQRLANVIGRRVKVAGCDSRDKDTGKSGLFITIDNFNDVELLQ